MFISVVNHSGAFYSQSISANEMNALKVQSGVSTNPMLTCFSASRYSGIYQDNAGVRPNSVVTAYYIKYV